MASDLATPEFVGTPKLDNSAPAATESFSEEKPEPPMRTMPRAASASTTATCKPPEDGRMTRFV